MTIGAVFPPAVDGVIYGACRLNAAVFLCKLTLWLPCLNFWVFLKLHPWRYPPVDGNNWGAVNFNECELAQLDQSELLAGCQTLK